jgi:hypothetical protein
MSQIARDSTSMQRIIAIRNLLQVIPPVSSGIFATCA